MTLLQQLTEQTQELKVQYIRQTTDWAKSSYDRAVQQTQWKEADWCKYMGVEPVLRNAGKSNEFYSFPTGFFNTKASRYYANYKAEAERIVRIGLEEYTNRQVRAAELHYESSLLKLVDRLNKKGITDGSDFTIVTARVGVNLEITIHHSGKTTRAWTIVAEGVIQRPHYRYLVK